MAEASARTHRHQRWALGLSVALLRAEGFQARKMLDGVSEWQAAGLALAA